MNEAVKLIQKQQKQTKNKMVSAVGDQLIDMALSEPRVAELLAQDLRQDAMSIENAEKKIHEYARNNGGCTPPKEADRILREFYGLPPAPGAPVTMPPATTPPEPVDAPPPEAPVHVDLDAFF